eukprot:TRINITY_DN10431_c0_g1_i1.p1 TRINITY_DN10431_c0_g1~~TRINITY_DN10431_c0_g1_i1.p1  ORF type:complete len:190 (-),score=22.27 TRINITY_DN10431_c0_g1_i1:441-1010(-)
MFSVNFRLVLAIFWSISALADVVPCGSKAAFVQLCFEHNVCLSDAPAGNCTLDASACAFFPGFPSIRDGSCCKSGGVYLEKAAACQCFDGYGGTQCLQIRADPSPISPPTPIENGPRTLFLREKTSKDDWTWTISGPENTVFLRVFPMSDTWGLSIATDLYGMAVNAALNGSIHVDGDGQAFFFKILVR